MYNQLTHTGGGGGGGGDDHVVMYVKKYYEYVYAFALANHNYMTPCTMMVVVANR